MTSQKRFTDATKLLTTVHRHGWRNRWHRMPGKHIAIFGVVAGVALVALAWLANDHATAIADGIERALRFPAIVMIVVGWIAFAFTVRLRRQSRRDAAHSWLAALPLGAQAFTASARRRIASTIAVALAIAIALLFVLGGLLSLPGRSILTLALLLAIGSIVGAVIGWTLARKDRRVTRIRLPSTVGSAKRQRFPLGRWPLSHSRAHADFGLHARAIGALLLSLPIGVPPLVVIAVIVFGLMALLIGDQLRALFAVTRHAGGWLRSLPLSPRTATFALGNRTLPVIVAAAITLVVAMTPSGMGGITAVVIVAAISAVATVGYIVHATLKQPFGARR